MSLNTFFPAAEILIHTLYIDHPIIKHHKAVDTAENIYDAIKDCIEPEQLEGGSYVGPYHHAKENVPHLINIKLGKADTDTHSDHDYLHRDV